jgi:hypothetical protein
VPRSQVQRYRSRFVIGRFSFRLSAGTLAVLIVLAVFFSLSKLLPGQFRPKPLPCKFFFYNSSLYVRPIFVTLPLGISAIEEPDVFEYLHSNSSFIILLPSRKSSEFVWKFNDVFASDQAYKNEIGTHSFRYRFCLHHQGLI